MKLRPNFGAFCAIGANINLASTSENRFSEFLIFLSLPNLIKRVLLEITKLVRCILIKTAWNNQTVPSKYA
jgi:hypothetical protein